MAGSAPEDRVPVLHVVTDDGVLARPGFLDAAGEVLGAGGGAVALHVRGPGTTGGGLYALVRALADPASRAGACLVVNDRVDVALAAGADGAHLGMRSLPVVEARRILGPRAWLGCSVHDEEEADRAASEGVDWAFAGHVYETPSHLGRPGLGAEGLAALCRAVPGVPVVAIGGITPRRVAEARGAGAWGVAVIRGVWEAPDPARAVGDYLHALSAADGEQKE